ncbi:MAG: hypothetical protein Q7U91_11830 [Sideroxyarcus sp.]|nr:hypothetical protein [Sideroxyarcus sp.]
MNLQIESSAKTKNMDSSQSRRLVLKAEHLTERHTPPVLLLDVNGFIQECGKTVEKIFGYRQHELVWQHISCLFPQLVDMPLMQGNHLNPMLNYICHCDHVFEAINKQSDIVVCHLNFFLVEYKGMQNLRLIVRPVAEENA